MNTSTVRLYTRISLIICTLLLASCEVELYSNVTERQANGMLKALLNKGIDASKEFIGKGLYVVKVPESHLVAAVNVLDAEGLPSEQYTDLKEMYKKEGLISSPMEERIRYMYSLSQSIAETLTNIDGVLVARVHVAVPESDKFSGRKNPTSASVFIKYQKGFELVGAKSEIKRIVENSIEGLSYQKIAVYLSSSNVGQEANSDIGIVDSDSLVVAEEAASLMKYLALLMFCLLLMLIVIVFWLFNKHEYLGDVKKQISSIRERLMKRVNKVLVALERSPKTN